MYNALGQVTDTWAYNTLSGPRTDVYHGASTFDGDNRLTGLDFTSNGGSNAIDDFGWTFNGANLVTSFTSNDGTADYGYLWPMQPPKTIFSHGHQRVAWLITVASGKR